MKDFPSLLASGLWETGPFPPSDNFWSLLVQAAAHLLKLVSAGLLLLPPLGCGQSGPPRYHVSGTVTYQGEPVPVGSILFQPDPTKGNSGPYGNAAIKDGKYDTRLDGQPTCGGSQIVIVQAFDGEHFTEYTPYGAPLGDGYQQPHELPKKDATLDIELTERPK